MTDRKFYLWAGVVLILAIGMHLFFFSRGFYSIAWDESGRTLDAYTWAAHGTVMQPAWLPFYRILVGTSLKLLPNLFLTPRLLSFLFGLAVIPVTGWLAQELFQDRRVTALALLLSALCPERVTLSLSPLSSIMFTFVIAVAMSFFARWLRTNSRGVLLATTAVAVLATTLRYEGWIFGAAFFVAVAWSYRSGRTGRGDVLWVGTLLSLFPLAWALAIFPSANPVGVASHDMRVLSSTEVLRRNPLSQFVLVNAASLNLIALLSVAQLAVRGVWRHRAFLAVAFGPLLAASAVLLVARGGQTGPAWRMVGVWTVLLVPFTAYLLAGCAWPFSGGALRRTLGLGVALVVAGAFLHSTFQIERASTWAFPESSLRAGQYLERRIEDSPQDRVLIESSEYSFLNIQVASQHPDAFVLNSVPEQEKRAIAGGRI